jgi:peptide/nickel transport system substrate-binding protein
MKNMKRRIFLLTLLVILSIVLGACAPEATPTAEEVEETEPVVEETEEEVVTEEPTEEVAEEETVIPTEFPREETIYVSGAAWGPASTWNPFQPGSLANTTGTNGFVYEFLFHYNPLVGEMIPWLAESGEWADDVTYNITLRNSLTWSDGEPLTAEDVKFTFDLGLSYPALWFSTMRDYLTEVVVVDELNLQLSFEDPLYQEFENNLYNIPIVPKHIWENFSEEEIITGANEVPIGSGAYMYLTHAEDRNIWVRNDNWWGSDVFGAPAPRYIVDIRTSSNNVALGMVLKGELDLSNNFLPGVAELANQGYVDTYYEEAPYMLSANTAVLFLNTTKSPMDDSAFRRALAFAIDVPSIVNTAYAQLVKAANPTGLLPDLEKFVDQDVVADLGYTYDTEQAKQILADAGYVDVDDDGFVETPDGEPIALEVTCPNGWTDWMAAIEVIATSAQAAGINIQNVTPDYGAWNTSMQSGTFDMTLNNWAAMSNTPWTLYNLLFNHPIREQMQSGNFGRYDNQEMFDLVDQLAAVPSSDEEEMMNILSQIQTTMLEDMPMIPLWYNGLWAQFNSSHWTNWPSENNDVSGMPITWSGYWQLGGLQMLIDLEPVTAE